MIVPHPRCFASCIRSFMGKVLRFKVHDGIPIIPVRLFPSKWTSTSLFAVSNSVRPTVFRPKFAAYRISMFGKRLNKSTGN